jgi:AcrR family transcriptional regulator
VTIFRHFKSKERILLELLEDVTDIRTKLETSIQGDFSSLKELLNHFARTYYEILVHDKEILMICMIEADNSDVIRLFGRMPMTAVDVLSAKLEQLHRQGKLPPGDYCTAAHMFVSTFFYAFMGKYRAKIEGIDMEQLYENATEILLRGLENS